MYNNYNNINKLCETYLHHIQLGNVEEVEKWLKNESIWTEEFINKLSDPYQENNYGISFIISINPPRVKELINVILDNKNLTKTIADDLYLAINSNRIEMFKDILNHNSMSQLDLTQSYFYSIIFKLIESGNSETVKWLLTNEKENFRISPRGNNDEALLIAAQNGSFELVKYLTTSSELTEHCSPRADNDMALVLALSNNHKEIVDFLMFSSELKENCEICAHYYLGIDNLLESKHYDLLYYLLTEKEVELPRENWENKYIHDKVFQQEVNSLWDKVDLYKSLQMLKNKPQSKKYKV